MNFCFNRLLPESVPWLVANGKRIQAEDILQKASHFNNIKYNGPYLEQNKPNEPEIEVTEKKGFDIKAFLSYNEHLQLVLHGVKSRILLLYSSVMCILW